MSFTGKATYAQLYPSRPPSDACRADDRYEYGSVFRSFNGKYFLLIQIENGLSLVGLRDGNRVSDDPIPECDDTRLNRRRTCTIYQLQRYCGGLEYVGLAKDVLVIFADEDA